jgi:putative hydrolase of the HAD superfamily
MANSAFKAVLWDFGGVMSESPFAAFSRFERERGLPDSFLRKINSANPDNNAWARFERSEITAEEFDLQFAAESRRAGHQIGGFEVIDLLFGELRPEMLEAVKRCKKHYAVACLTNNIRQAEHHGLQRDPRRANEWREAMELFDATIQSSEVGIRKPEPRFYQLACETLSIMPRQAIYLDDLGINLKPAQEMGMTTIKVTDPVVALRSLEKLLDLPLL